MGTDINVIEKLREEVKRLNKHVETLREALKVTKWRLELLDEDSMGCGWRDGKPWSGRNETISTVCDALRKTD